MPLPVSEIKRKILIGADPELFLKENGKFISAHDKLPGTKEAPHKVDYGAVQVDGVAAEFNIDPAPDESRFLYNCKSVMLTLQGMVGSSVLTIAPTVTFDKAYWDTLPEVTKTLGCNPDFNGWTGDRNPSPDSEQTLRTASGHVHGGWAKNKDITDPDHMVDCGILARQLDYYLGIFSLIWDADKKRRTMYGKAGTFRPKPYGIEYRVLSNRWLINDYLISFVYKQTFWCIYNLLNGQALFEDTYGSLARQVIDDSEPWFLDSKHRLWKVVSQLGVDTGRLVSKFKDPLWAEVELEILQKSQPKPKPKGNFYLKVA